MQTSLKISELIKHFLRDQDVRENSKRLYKSHITQFFLWCAKNSLDGRSLTRSDIVSFKDDILNRLALSTVESKMVVVKKFFYWCEENNYYTDIARRVKLPRMKKLFKKQALTIQQVENLLSVIETKTITGLRDYAMINLMLRSGLRCIEVSRLNIEDIQVIEGQTVLKIQGKGRLEKDDFVVLTDKALVAINHYLEVRTNLKDGQAVFINLHKHWYGTRIAPKHMSGIIKRYLRLSGLDSPNITAHSLRHTAGVLLLEAGEDLYSVQLFLRHTSPKITEVYLKSIETKRKLKNSPSVAFDKMFG